MSLFNKEMKYRYKSLLVWAFSTVALIIVGMIKFTDIVSGNEAMMGIFVNMPQIVKSLIGVGSFDMTTPIGYFAVLYLYVLAIAGVYASSLGNSMLTSEECDRTADFVLTKPVTRMSVLSTKILVSILFLILYNIIVFAATKVSFQVFATSSYLPMSLFFGIFMFQLFFMSLGFASASYIANPKKSSSVATVFLLVSFLISVAYDISKTVNLLTFLTPFQYFSAERLIGGGLSVNYSVISLMLSLLFIVICYRFYEKRDIL